MFLFTVSLSFQNQKYYWSVFINGYAFKQYEERWSAIIHDKHYFMTDKAQWMKHKYALNAVQLYNGYGLT